MKKSLKFTSCFFMIFLLTFGFQKSIFSSPIIQNPESYFGFYPGEDRMLFDYQNLIGYLKILEKSSPRLKLSEIGQSPMGKKIYICFISSENNLKNLQTLKKFNKSLAVDPDMAQKERELILEKGKVFVLATLSMHSGEVGPSQSAPLIAYKLVTSDKEQVLKILDKVIYMMVPCHNPDGMDMVINHYKKYHGTKYEGCSLPGIYHKYVGHDNNRDFITLSQKDNQAIAKIYSQDWFPQVMVEKHQMGSRGVRYFVPPSHDPIAENINAGLWNWIGIFGSNMIKDMTASGLSGVAQHYLFDMYWPGSTETCLWKNVISFLTESASVKYATPIFIEANELTVSGKGLAEYKKSTNMPLPWPGGWWKLKDIINYEIASTMSILKTAASHRKDILKFRNTLCQKEITNGKTIAPFYYFLPQKQHDKSELICLVNLLMKHGVNIFSLNSDITVNNRAYKKGDLVIPLSQPFRPFIKEVMEKQNFPIRHYTLGGKIIKPYDITSWSLPLHRGVEVIEINKITDVSNCLKKIDSSLTKLNKPFTPIKEGKTNYWAAIFSANNNESYKAAFKALKLGLSVKRLTETFHVSETQIPAGSFLISNDKKNIRQRNEIFDNLYLPPLFVDNAIKIKARHVKLPRIALIETYFHDMDAGWTRYIFDTYHIPFNIIRPGDFEKTEFIKNYDVVIFPDSIKSILKDGKLPAWARYYVLDYPPQYTKGIGKKGMEKLLQFLENGGTIISWGYSTALFMGEHKLRLSNNRTEVFQLPVKDISQKIKDSGFYCPGSLLKIKLLKNHPLTWGMPSEIGVFYRGRAVFETSIPIFDMDRRVIGKFPEKNILLSGYCQEEKKLSNKTIMVWLKKNRGQLILFGFHPQFRASTQATYKLIFNAILLNKIP